MQRDRHGLDQRGVTHRQPVGHPQHLVGVHGLEPGERSLPLVLTGTDLAPLDTQGRPAGEAVLADPAPWRRTTDDLLADDPALDVAPERDDGAAVLVALDRARLRRALPLDHEVEVGSADAAVADLEQDLSRPERRKGPVLHVDVAQPLQDRGRHRRR